MYWISTEKKSPDLSHLGPIWHTLGSNLIALYDWVSGQLSGLHFACGQSRAGVMTNVSIWVLWRPFEAVDLDLTGGVMALYSGSHSPNTSNNVWVMALCSSMFIVVLSNCPADRPLCSCVVLSTSYVLSPVCSIYCCVNSGLLSSPISILSKSPNL